MLAALVALGSGLSVARAQGVAAGFERETSWHRTQKVFALAQTPDGYVWAGTDSGLLRTDGRDFRTFTSSNTPGLRRNVVRSLLVDAQGALWVGMDEGGGVAVVRGRSIAAWNTGRALDGRVVVALAASAQTPKLWLGTDAGLAVVDRDHPGTCSFVPELGAQEIVALAQGRDDARGDALAVGARDGLWELRGTSWRRAGHPDGVVALARDREGALWISDARQGLFRRNASGEETRLAPLETSGHVQTAFSAIGFDAQGEPWVGWNWGHGRLVGTTLDPKRTNGQHTVAFLTDAEGGFWVGTRWGVVSRYGLARVRNEVTSAPDEAPLAFSVARSSDGALWTTHVGSVVREDAGASRRWATGKDLPSWCPRSLAPARDGGMWLGTCDAGLVRLQGDQAIALGATHPRGARNLQAVLEDHGGTLWMGSMLGDLYRLDGGAATPVPAENGRCAPDAAESIVADECPFSITAMADARAGGIWVALRRNGLRRVHDGRVDVFTRERGLPTNDLVALFEDAEGVLWLGTQAHGVVRFKNGTFRSADASVGLPAQSIHGIVEHGGHLWMSSERGVFRIQKAQLDELFDGKRASVEGYTYGLDDGMASLITVQSFPPPIVLTPDGLVAVPTDRGVAMVDTRRVDDTSGFALPIVEELRLDGVERDPTRTSTEELRFGESGLASLEVRIAIPNFTVPHRIGLQHRLRGFDAGWRSTGAERTVRYFNVPAGSYTFEVRGQLDGRPWHAPVATQPIVVRAFTERLAFRALLALALGLIGGMGLTTWLWLQRRRFNAVIVERNRIARDLHDSLAQYFTALAYQLERLTQLVRDKPDEAIAIGEQTKQVLRQARLEARESIHNLRAEQMARKPLGETLRAIVDQTRLSGRAELSYEQSGADRVVDEELQRQIARIVQEATVNALAHAQAQNVIVKATFEPGGVSVHVLDDGEGFAEPDRPRPGHHGLAGMRERAAAIGAQLDIKTSDGEGTMIELRVAL